MIFNRSDFDAILTPSPSPFPIPIRWLPVPRCVFPFMLGSAVDGMKPLPFFVFFFFFFVVASRSFCCCPVRLCVGIAYSIGGSVSFLVRIVFCEMYVWKGRSRELGLGGRDVFHFAFLTISILLSVLQ